MEGSEVKVVTTDNTERYGTAGQRTETGLWLLLSGPGRNGARKGASRFYPWYNVLYVEVQP